MGIDVRDFSKAGYTVSGTWRENVLLIGPKEEKIVLLKDSSTKRRFVLFAHKDSRSAKDAIARSFGLDETEYDPEVET